VKWIGSIAPSSPAGLKTHSIDTSNDQPLPARFYFIADAFQCAAESNIRGTVIIDKNGCLVAENWWTKRLHTRSCFFLFRRSRRNGKPRVCDVPAVRHYAKLFRTTAVKYDMNRRINDERTSRRREFTGVFKRTAEPLSSNSTQPDTNCQSFKRKIACEK